MLPAAANPSAAARTPRGATRGRLALVALGGVTELWQAGGVVAVLAMLAFLGTAVVLVLKG